MPYPLARIGFQVSGVPPQADQVSGLFNFGFWISD
jgi:hypothetical protein